MSRTDWRTIGEIEQAARAVVTPELWDGLIGGAGHEVTLRRNVAALERVALMPRVLRGVGDCDLSVQLLGRRLALPVLIAPIGEIGRFHDDGARAVAVGAEGAGSAAYVSVVSMPSLEEVRAASTAPLIFQIYMFGDRAWLERMVRRVEVAGYDALCVTVDTPVGGRKDRDLRNRLALAPLPRPNLDRNELPPYFGAGLTWDDIAWMRDLTTLPIILKGILHPGDARLAVDHGVDVVHLSNHGGQQLDDAPSTFELLGDVVAAVAQRATIVIDSGFSRGTDVIKALALGADAVAMGRLPVMALAAGGAAGITAALEIIADEMRVSMVNLGLGSLNELNEGVLRATDPPTAADREARDASHLIPAPGTEELGTDPRDDESGVGRIAVVVLAGGLMAGLDITIVSVAIAALSRHLHSSLAATQWVITAYLLAIGATVPLVAWSSRRFGTRRLFVGGLMLFTAGSGLCGLSWSLPSLVAFRALQGLGGGMLNPVGQLILARVAERDRLGRTLGLFALPAVLAPVTGPVLGGLILQHLSWRWIFFINVPIGSVTLVLALRLLPRTFRELAGRLDLIGFALVTGGMVGSTVALGALAARGADRTAVPLALLIASVSAFAIFTRRMLRSQTPLLDVRLFANGRYTLACGACLLLSAATFGNMFLLPLYFQTVHGTPPAQTGLLMGTQSISLGASMAISGRLVDRLGGVRVALAGIVAMTVGTVCFSVVGAGTSYWLLVTMLLARGVGVGAASMPMIVAAYAALSKDALADGTSLLGLGQRIAGSLGTSLLAVVLQHQLSSSDTRADAFRHTYVWAAVLTATSLAPAAALAILERRRRLATATGEARFHTGVGT